MANSVDPDEQSDMLFTQTCLSENFGPLTVDKEHEVFIITNKFFHPQSQQNVFCYCQLSSYNHSERLRPPLHHRQLYCIMLFGPVSDMQIGAKSIILFFKGCLVYFNRNSFIKCILHLLI